MRQGNLHPGDVVVALQLVLIPEPPLATLAERAGRSIGECHNAIRRLQASGLVVAERRSTEREPLLRFFDAGIRVAFPPSIGGETIGVATAFLPGNAPVGASSALDVGAETSEFVWPAAVGSTRGQALAPLHPRVASLVGGNGDLWHLLALVDLIRVGGAREHREAMDVLRLRLASGPASGG